MARAPRKNAGTGGDGRALKNNDNERAKDEAESIQLISYVSKLQGYDQQIAEHMEVVSGLREERGSVVNLAKAAGFKKYELQDIIDDLKKPRTDLAKREERRAKLRSYYGLPAGKAEQHEMTPETVKDETFWRAAGYTGGLNGEMADIPGAAGVHGQAWMAGYHDGQARRIMALSPDKNQPIPAETPGDGFEASPDELKAQITRQQVEGAKASLDKLDAPPEAEGV